MGANQGLFLTFHYGQKQEIKVCFLHVHPGPKNKKILSHYGCLSDPVSYFPLRTKAGIKGVFRVCFLFSDSVLNEVLSSTRGFDVIIGCTSHHPEASSIKSAPHAPHASHLPDKSLRRTFPSIKAPSRDANIPPLLRRSCGECIAASFRFQPHRAGSRSSQP